MENKKKVNYFFLTENPRINCQLEIPKFQNRGLVDAELKLFCASIDKDMWHIRVADCEQDESFFMLRPAFMTLTVYTFWQELKKWAQKIIR